MTIATIMVLASLKSNIIHLSHNYRHFRLSWQAQIEVNFAPMKLDPLFVLRLRGFDGELNRVFDDRQYFRPVAMISFWFAVGDISAWYRLWPWPYQREWTYPALLPDGASVEWPLFPP
jgi:hypothetical protein